ncbi:hypothetical protein E2C01_087987 [Portunus trituberculatus]|uniref:Uncharacterized protein n=1 Tax=Portunus trituberculatus TaxID=210409 RepID=A0A5B7JKS4_PORTR|nr:hypothetical protein [Portunus trituberculatus]
MEKNERRQRVMINKRRTELVEKFVVSKVVPSSHRFLLRSSSARLRARIPLHFSSATAYHPPFRLPSRRHPHRQPSSPFLPTLLLHLNPTITFRPRELLNDACF